MTAGDECRKNVRIINRKMGEEYEKPPLPKSLQELHEKQQAKLAQKKEAERKVLGRNERYGPAAGIWKASGRDQVQADWSGVGPRCTG